MRKRRNLRQRERGAALLEFAISGVVLLTAVFATFDFGRLLWIHNALGDAVLNGTRYAVSHASDSATMAEVRNVVVYNNKAGGTKPIVSGLTTGMVQIVYDNMGLGSGTATVKVAGYQFRFVSLIGWTLAMPTYRTTLTGETVGFAPPVI